MKKVHYSNDDVPKESAIDVVVVYKALKYDERITCQYKFASNVMKAGTVYPSVVNHMCSRCEREHTFQPQGAYIVATPTKRKIFDEYCIAQKILEVDVKVVWEIK